MKEKSKRILKGIGVSALACFGMFAMTGCAVNLNQEQIDKIMYTVDNCDQFMHDSLDLIDKQNSKLNSEQAWNLYHLAKTKVYLNKDNVRDNLKITAQNAEDGGDIVIYLYKDSTCGYIETTIGAGYHDITYEHEGAVYYYYYDEEHGTRKEKRGDGQAEKYLYSITNLPYANYKEVTNEHIVSYKILDNGNYKISFVNTWSDDPDQYIETNLIDVEITPNAEFVSETVLTGTYVVNDGEGNSYFIFDKEMKISYEYGVLTYSDIENLVNEAKQAPLT